MIELTRTDKLAHSYKFNNMGVKPEYIYCVYSRTRPDFYSFNEIEEPLLIHKNGRSIYINEEYNFEDIYEIVSDMQCNDVIILLYNDEDYFREKYFELFL